MDVLHRLPMYDNQRISPLKQFHPLNTIWPMLSVAAYHFHFAYSRVPNDTTAGISMSRRFVSGARPAKWVATFLSLDRFGEGAILRVVSRSDSTKINDVMGIKPKSATGTAGYPMEVRELDFFVAFAWTKKIRAYVALRNIVNILSYRYPKKNLSILGTHSIKTTNVKAEVKLFL